MVVNIKGRDFLTLMEYSGEELKFILETALKIKRVEGLREALKGKHLALIFQRPSTRTRVSFEVAISQLGGHYTTLAWGESQLGRGETIADTARTLERYVDCVIARVESHETLEEFAAYASIPVINALSDTHHPCQALSDMLTILEKKGRLEHVKLAWVGDGNNVAHSLLVACAKLGVNLAIASPSKYQPLKGIVDYALREASKSGATIKIVEEPEEAVKGADLVYTDTFVSMGKEEEREERMRTFIPKFRVTRSLLSLASSGCLFMHCLPAHRGEEVENEVIDGGSSVVWEQAENRLHLQKGLLSLLL